MIVKSHQKGWEIIYQKAHGLLALQLALPWAQAQRPVRWVETLAAILEHDDGHNDTEHQVLTEAGAPLNFRLREYTLEQCQSVARLTRQKSRWQALMVSMHLSFLYEGKGDQHPDLAAFLDEQKRWQRRYLRELGVKRPEAERAYRLVEWCDAFSLLLCTGMIQPEQRKMDISTGPDGTVHQVWQREDGSLGVTPWPYDVDQFTVNVESRLVPQLHFSSGQELLDALEATDPTETQWTLRR